MLHLVKIPFSVPEDMDIIDGMPASRPSCPDSSREPWEG